MTILTSYFNFVAWAYSSFWPTVVLGLLGVAVWELFWTWYITKHETANDWENTVFKHSDNDALIALVFLFPFVIVASAPVLPIVCTVLLLAGGIGYWLTIRVIRSAEKSGRKVLADTKRKKNEERISILQDAINEYLIVSTVGLNLQGEKTTVDSVLYNWRVSDAFLDAYGGGWSLFKSLPEDKWCDTLMARITTLREESENANA